ncbi:unnamed protein product [Phytophthora fragariaefolia]|uniref:Unnamed protein product n=1 Tax=Phytophthora fragariaefolia TaxID=1490495 RepID=A0A9W6UC55_9STRA|nr:unnamed protein product [Phytophthora fragariaefolia]
MMKGSTSLRFSIQTHLDQDDDAQVSTKKPKHRDTVRASSYERQQRYRERQRQYTVRLESTVERLRMDVDQLLLVRHEEHKTQRVAREVRSGFVTNSTDATTAAAFVTLMCQCMHYFGSGDRAKQAKFLETNMRRDVQYIDHVGSMSILDQWTLFTLNFDGKTPVVERCTFNVGFSEQTCTVGHVMQSSSFA